MNRYTRQENIVNQENLKNATVFIAGIGGLGSFSSLYLTLAGIGKLILVDMDKMEINNLNRHVLCHPRDLGKKKVMVAKNRLSEINPDVEIIPVFDKISENFKIPENVDIVVDSLDSYESRFILEKLAMKSGVPYVFGAVEGYMGMVTFIDRTTKKLKDFIPKFKRNEPQVLGVTVGFTASIQAMEVIKYLSKEGDLLRNRLLIYDGLSTNFLEVKL